MSQALTWPRIRKHLQEKLERARAAQDSAEGNEMYRLQGDVRTLKGLLNLPEAVALVDEEDARVAHEAPRSK